MSPDLDFIKSCDTQSDKTKGLSLGALAGANVSVPLSLGYMKVAPVNRSVLPAALEDKVMNKLLDKAHDLNTPVVSRAGDTGRSWAGRSWAGRILPSNSIMPADGVIGKILKLMGPHYVEAGSAGGDALMEDHLTPARMSTNPKGMVNMNANHPTSHVLAHELGHGTQSKLLKNPWFRGTGHLGALSALVPVMSGNQEAGRNAAVAGTALSIPTLVGELSASHRGAGLVRGAMGAAEHRALPLLKRMSPYIGIPTYAAAALAPTLAYQGRKLTGGYKQAAQMLRDLKSGMGFSRRDQGTRDLNTAAMLGGSAVAGHTAAQAGRGMELANSMEGMHKDLIANPRRYSNAKDSIAFLRNYADAAGEAANLRIAGLPAGRLFSMMPPSIVSNAEHPATFKDIMRLRFTNGRGVSPATADAARSSIQHYKGFVSNPKDTLLREMLTGKAHGTVNELLPTARRLGLSQGDFQVLLDGQMKDPLEQLVRMVEIRDPGKVRHLRSMTYPLMRNLTLGNTTTTMSQAAAGMFDRTKALSIGPAAYAAGARGAAGRLVPLGIAAAAGLGIWGGSRAVGDHIKLSSTMAKVKNWWDRDVLDKPSPVQAAGGAGAIGGGAWTFQRGLQYRPSDLLLVTGGRVAPPVNVIDVGAGHITPAKAIYEELQKHPAVRNGEFTADIALREMDAKAMSRIKKTPGMWEALRFKNNRRYQLPVEPADVGSHGKRHALMTVDTGFGATHAADYGGAWKRPGFSMNPGGLVGALPDSALDINNGRRFLFGGKPTHMWKRMGLTSFGNPTEVEGGRFQRLAHYPVNPAIQDSVLDLAEKRLAQGVTPESRNATWMTMAQKLEDAGDLRGANTLKDAIKANKKIMLITGSSRGDFVAQRARTLDRLLRSKPELANKMLMVNMHGSSLDSNLTKSLLDKTQHPMVNIGDTRKYFGDARGSTALFDLLNASDLHYGSTGASAFAEANLSKTPSVFITHYDPWRAKLRKLITNKGIDLPEMDRRNLEMVNLDQWNAGTLKDIRNSSPNSGIGAAPKASDALRYLEKMLKGEAVSDRSAEAAKFLQQARVSKKDLIEELINHARDVQSKTKGRMFRRLGGGALLAGAGTMSLLDYTKRNGNTTSSRVADMFSNKHP